MFGVLGCLGFRFWALHFVLDGFTFDWCAYGFLLVLDLICTLMFTFDILSFVCYFVCDHFCLMFVGRVGSCLVWV